MKLTMLSSKVLEEGRNIHFNNFMERKLIEVGITKKM